MSRRPQASLSRPRGSTGASGAKSRAGKIARAKRFDLSPFPVCGHNGKHILKQGFPNSKGKSR